jgi:hypothetical protein
MSYKPIKIVKIPVGEVEEGKEVNRIYDGSLLRPEKIIHYYESSELDKSKLIDLSPRVVDYYQLGKLGER